MVRRLSASLVALTMTTMWLVATAVPAAAACHIAGFVEREVEAAASTGVVSLVVELQGRVGSCAGTVDVATVDGTAIAGEDYEAVTRTLTFEENDDRVETVDVTILGEAADGGTFTLELSNPTGDISGTGEPATVTITQDAAPGDGAAEEETTGTDEGTEPDEASDVEDEGGDAADEGEDDGLSIGIILGVVAAIAIGIGAFVVLRGRA